MKVNQLIEKIANIAGIDLTDEAYKDVLATQAEIDLPESFFEKLNLLTTIEKAKKHPELHKHFKATFSNTFDKKISDFLENVGINKNELELFDEVPTFEKLSKISDVLKGKKNNHSTNEDFEAAKKRIAELQEKLNLAEKKSEEAINKFKSDINSKLLKKELQAKLAKYKVVKELEDDDVKMTVFNKKLEDILRQNKAKLVYEDGIKLVSEDSDELEAIDMKTNQPLSFDKIADTIMSNYIAANTNSSHSATTTVSTFQRGADGAKERKTLNGFGELLEAINTAQKQII